MNSLILRKGRRHKPGTLVGTVTITITGELSLNMAVGKGLGLTLTEPHPTTPRFRSGSSVRVRQSGYPPGNQKWPR